MIDQHERITDLVKDALAKSCRARGIDPSEAGYAVSGGGQVMPMISNTGDLGFASGWGLLVTLRSKLIGQPPIGVMVAVPGGMPSDDDFRTAVDALVDSANNQRGAEFFGRPVPTM